MSSDSYCKADIENIEKSLKEKVLRLPSKCPASLANGYMSEVYTTSNLKVDRL